MPSLVSRVKIELEERGEYVVLANASTGWFAINPNTWERRLEQCRVLGRDGPNLIVYRTISGGERDHHVVPFQVVSRILVPESLKLQKNGTYRWNLTLHDEKLHVSHRAGYEPTDKFLAEHLILEDESSTSLDESILTEQLLIRTAENEGIVEGIARETVVYSKSRSTALRQEALIRSKGVCEACGIDFSFVFNGRGLRALQVHHKRQLALREVPEITVLEELSVVCANCHAIIHTNPRSAIPVEELRDDWVKHRGGIA